MKWPKGRGEWIFNTVFREIKAHNYRSQTFPNFSCVHESLFKFVKIFI